MIVQTLNLNIIPGKQVPVVYVNQNDHNTDRLQINLIGDGISGTAQIQGTRPDGGTFQDDATRSGQTVTADLTEEMTAVCGDVVAQIVLTDGDNRTGSQDFILRVQRSANDNPDI